MARSGKESLGIKTVLGHVILSSRGYEVLAERAAYEVETESREFDRPLPDAIDGKEVIGFDDEGVVGGPRVPDDDRAVETVDPVRLDRARECRSGATGTCKRELTGRGARSRRRSLERAREIGAGSAPTRRAREPRAMRCPICAATERSSTRTGLTRGVEEREPHDVPRRRFAPMRQRSADTQSVVIIGFSGGRDRDRTCDPFHVKEVLYR